MQLPFHDPVLPTYLKALKKKHQTIRCQNYKIYFPVGTTIERSTLHRYVNWDISIKNTGDNSYNKGSMK